MTDKLRAAAEAAIGAMVRAAITGHSDALDGYAEALRAALAEQDASWVEIGPEWTPCVKRPVTVHVRSQRVGEKHVSTREGITPVKPDDLIMRGVDGEEYPIGRDLFDRTYFVGVARIKQAAGQDAEPYLWYADDTGDTWTPDAVVEGWAPTDLRPLYAHPPRSEWQSLTDEEMYAAYESAPTRWDRHIRGLRTIEAALKEKNT